MFVSFHLYHISRVGNGLVFGTMSGCCSVFIIVLSLLIRSWNAEVLYSALLIRIWIWTYSHWRRNWAEIMSGHVSCHFYSFVLNIGVVYISALFPALLCDKSLKRAAYWHSRVLKLTWDWKFQALWVLMTLLMIQKCCRRINVEEEVCLCVRGEAQRWSCLRSGRVFQCMPVQNIQEAVGWRDLYIHIHASHTYRLKREMLIKRPFY